ncbi:hypothetical protein [Weissella confusa]|uniref:hypothetical protein n=1 Tax=Weissella confusa TaxID=1583 RepID=UPI00223C3ABF|nr:hypothetical protein [Weissella confusa]MCT0013868.1 hypothetical protein [Weissella confusa]
MTDKAYIVANKEQELDVLKKFEEKGIVWRSGDNATDFKLNEFFQSPYALVESESITWASIEQIEDKTIVYDGRKEEKWIRSTR